MLPAFVWHVQGFADQQAPETRAVNEKITLDNLPAVQLKTFDIAVIPPVNMYNMTTDTLNKVLFGKIAQIRDNPGRVQV